MKKRYFIIIVYCIFFIVFIISTPSLISAETVVNFTSNGSWIAPNGVSLITVRAWGAGGGGGGGGSSNANGGGGGAGGQYVMSTFAVSPGTVYNITIGTGGVSGARGINGTDGGDTIFNFTLVVAKGGAGGVVYNDITTFGFGGTGTIVGAVGNGGAEDVFYKGGNGGSGTSSFSGGGGGGPGTTGQGQSAWENLQGFGTLFHGGEGGAGTSSNSGVGGPGLNYGAGSGGSTKNGIGGVLGAQGLLIINYTAEITDTCTAPESGNWDISCSDNCIWNTNFNVPANITMTGSGTLTLNANMSLTSPHWQIFKQDGCKLVINQGGSIR